MKSKKLLQTLFGMGLILMLLVGYRVSATPKPMSPPDGPWLDEVYGATSIDGLHFTEIPGPFFRQASVPDVVEITSRESQAAPSGTLLLYYVDYMVFKKRP
jgi:hypothetical protein